MYKKLTACIVTASMLFSSAAVYAGPVYDPDTDIREETLPLGDMEEIDGIELISGGEPDIYTDELRIAADIPGFYSYGSDNGREYLLNNKPKSYVDCYDDLLAQCKAFEGNYKDVQQNIVNGSEIYYLPKPAGESYRYSMTLDEIRSVVVTFLKDHPECYWLKAFVYSYSSQGGPYTISLTIESEYAAGAARKDLDSHIQTNFEKYVSAAEKYKAQGAYMTARKVHDDIAEAVEYGYDYIDINGVTYMSPSTSAAAHNIAAILDDDDDTMPVCEGYAEAYHLILNALGIDNIYVTGTGITSSGSEAHAWNMIRLDDGKYYWADLTWDDRKTDISYNYFARGNDGFSASHIQDSPENTGSYFQYDLPNVPDTDFEVIPLINKDLLEGMEITRSGTCNYDLSWAIYENRVLYISGEGEMDDFEFDYETQTSYTPWYEYESEFSIVIVDEGVTWISGMSFWKCIGVAYVYLSDGVRQIDYHAFSNCVNLRAVRIPSSVSSIGFYAFSGSNQHGNFTDIYYGGTETQWGSVNKTNADIPSGVIMHYTAEAEPTPTATAPPATAAPTATAPPATATPITTYEPTEPPEQKEYEIQAIVIADDAGDETALSQVSGSFKVYVDVAANAERDKTDIVIIALYDENGKMIAVGSYESAFERDNVYRIEFGIPDIGEKTASIKTFIWDSYGNPEPLSIMKAIE